jgi:hypothetical protein
VNPHYIKISLAAWTIQNLETTQITGSPCKILMSNKCNTILLLGIKSEVECTENLHNSDADEERHNSISVPKTTK